MFTNRSFRLFVALLIFFLLAACDPDTPDSSDSDNSASSSSSSSDSSNVVPDTPPQIRVTSNPSGALVECGIQSVNNIVTSGTGRILGRTPVTAEIYESDLAYVSSSGFYNITCELTLDGYFPTYSIFGIGESGQLEHNRTYTIDEDLTPLG